MSVFRDLRIRFTSIFLLFISTFCHADLNDGLVAWWKLDEGSGSIAEDFSENNRTLTLQNGITWTDGVIKQGVQLDGSDDQISLSSLSIEGSFSLSLWVNPQSDTDLQGNESANQNVSVTPLNKTIVYPAHGYESAFGVGLAIGTNGISSLIHASNIYCQPLIYNSSINDWTHVVLVLENRQPKLFVNGAFAKMGLSLNRPVKFEISSDAPIGKGYENEDRYQGGLSDFRIYDRVLSEAEIKQLQIIDNPNFREISGLGYTFVDDNLSSGGPWALLGYASNGNFPSKLNLASEQIDEGRQGSAVLNALNFAKNTPKFAITWTNAGSPKPNGGIDSYDHGVAFKFADTSLLTLTAELTPSAGSGSSNWSSVSTDPSTVLLNLEVIKGSPNLPSSMYARRETFGAMYGNAYGFAKSSSNAQLDWTVDGQAFNVLYLGINGNNGYVAPGSGGNANGYVPSTMAIWGQLKTPPYDLQTSGNLSIAENSDVGTVVDQFTATDNNDDDLTFSLLPALPSQFSPVLWLDANDSSTFSPVNGKISEWRDKSGNNYHYSQSDSVKYPSYSSDSLNGLPSITFDGNDFLTINSRLEFSANPDISIFAVTSFIDSQSSDNRIFQLGNSNHSLAVAGGTHGWSWRFNGGNERYGSIDLDSVGQQAWVRQQGSNYAASRFFLNGTEQVRVNGGAGTIVPSDNAAVSFIGTGASAGTIQNIFFSKVKISELIVLNDSSDTSRKAIETYLARKWGLNYPNSTSNGIFELEANGTLKSLFPLDREITASYPIVVRATDTSGNFIDQNFSVSVLDDGMEDTDEDGFLDSLEIVSGSDEKSDSSLPSDLPAYFGEATLWLDATNLDLLQNSTITDGGSISQWLDQSGNSHDLTVINSAKSPVLNKALVNSKDVVSFSGDSLKSNDAISVRSILTVHKTVHSHYLWDFREGVANSYIWRGDPGSYWAYHVKNGITQINVSLANIMNNQLQVSYFEGNAGGSGTFYLHSRFSNNEMGSGDICELLIFNRLLNQQELDSGEAYLAKKWGLDSIVDSDSDGFNDSVEYDAGSNPESNGSIPDLGYGLVAWYPFDGNSSDMSGNDRHATAVNSHSYVSAKVGEGVRIVGSSSAVNGHISLPYISSLASSNHTFAFWVLEESMLHYHGEDYLVYGQLERISNRQDGVAFPFSTSTDYITGINRSSWNHYTVTKSGSTRRGYLNGSLVATGSWESLSDVSSTPNHAALGRHWWSGGSSSSTRLVAVFDELRIYDRALIPTEILSLQTWDPTSPVSTNNSPGSLTFTQSQIAENKAVGTVLGNIVGTDPDGDQLTYQLTTGVGDGDNSLFVLETNGTLKSAIVFDYETDAHAYGIRVKVTDEHGASTEGNFTISLQDEDDTAPLITLTGNSNITHEAGFIYVDANASWTDAVDGSGVLVAAGEVNASKPGSYILSYNYTDAAGNVAETVTRTVSVVDTTAPVITLNGDANVTHEAGFAYVDANASWTDAVDGSGTVVGIGEVNTNVPGVYELTYDYTDEAGNDADTVIRKVNVINLAPHDLGFTSETILSVHENKPGGTLVANFVGDDENGGSVLSYQLMGVREANDSNTQEMNLFAGSEGLEVESVFDLDINGSLTTVRPFDYETDPLAFEILIRVTDQYGAYFEKPFLISVLNKIEDLDQDGIEDHYDLDDDGDGQTDELEIRLGLDPRDRFDHAHTGMVATLDFEYLQDEQYRLRGKLLADGRSSPIEYGFILTSVDRVSAFHTIITEDGTSTSEEFTKVVKDLELGKSYVYQAYVINELGMGVGQMKWIREISDVELPKILLGSEKLEGGWYSSWMGNFWMGEERKWLYHESLGWLFLSEDGQGGAWIWREPDGWLWTAPEVWPFLWSQQSTDWLYLTLIKGNAIFYDYSTGGLR